MTDSHDALDAVARAAEQLVPQLTDRLQRHGLGEIEVTHGDLRIRVTASPVAPASAASDAGSNRQAHSAERGADAGAPDSQAGSGAEPNPGLAATAESGDAPGVRVSAPAVGFFLYADGLGPGLAVERGDALGHVEMLGVRHDVRAPRRGTVRHLIAESGEAVEYGQVVVELEAGEAAR